MDIVEFQIARIVRKNKLYISLVFAYSSPKGVRSMSDQIKAGDTIQLKSGGPIMTVSSIGAIVEGGTVYAYCDWFEGSKNMQASFPLTSVKVVDR